jgi:hypothetical protein
MSNLNHVNFDPTNEQIYAITHHKTCKVRLNESKPECEPNEPIRKRKREEQVSQEQVSREQVSQEPTTKHFENVSQLITKKYY